MRKRVFGIGCAAIFALSSLSLPMWLPANGKLTAAAASSDNVTLVTYDGDRTLSVSLTEDGTLPELPIPTREGYDFVGWFTKEVTVEYWGDAQGEDWTALKKKYGTEYRYLNGRSIDWYNTKEEPDPRYADNAGYDWQNSRWIEHSLGLQNATKGEWVHEGDKVEKGTTLYAMYDPKNITVYWYSNGWKEIDDTEYASTGRSTGFEYGGKFARLPLDRWAPWNDGTHEFKGWIDANGNVFEFDMSYRGEMLANPYTPEKYEPVLRLYAIYDDVKTVGGYIKPAVFQGLTGGGRTFDPKLGSYTFTASLDSKRKKLPDKMDWELTSGSEHFDLTVSTDKTVATVTVKNEFKDKITDEEKVGVKFIFGDETYETYATASHYYNDGKVISGQWGSCTQPYTMQYTCTACGQKKTVVIDAQGHDYVTREVPATCTEDGYTEKVCVKCGERTRVNEARTARTAALGHDWQVTTEKGCGGTVTTKTCKRCGEVRTEQDDTPVHDWNTSYTVDRAATCTKDGSKSIRCKNCGAVKESAVIPATGHSYRNNTVKATCTQDGYTVHTCTVCGDSYTDSIVPALGHTYREEVERGCNGAEITIKTCTRCGTSETIGDRDALGHVWGEHLDEVPTCTKEGRKSILCTVCKTVKETVSVPALGHSYVVTEHEATCTEQGYSESVCSVCGDTVRKVLSEAKGHDFDVKTQKGCNGAVYTVKTCNTCGTVETEGSLDALGHVWGEQLDEAPTCTKEGRKSILCTVCKTVKETVSVPALGHSYVVTEHEATCTEEGYSESVCSVCGDTVRKVLSEAKGHDFDVKTQKGCNGAVYTVKTCNTCGTIETEGSLDALGHVWGEQLDEAPTCTKEGRKSILCTVCKTVKETVSVPALGHSYDVTEHEATCTEQGYSESVCSVCGDTVKEVLEEAKGHIAAEPLTEVAPDCITNGVVNTYCSVCGELLESEVLPADPALHAWSEWETRTEEGYEISSRSCTVCGESEENRTELPAPELPAEPELPELSAEPVPEVPELSEVPAEPEVSEVPAEPEVSEVPAEPEAPKTNFVPDLTNRTDAEEVPSVTGGTALSGHELAVDSAASLGETEPADGMWILIAVLTVCGAAAICIPTAIVVIKRRK